MLVLCNVILYLAWLRLAESRPDAVLSEIWCAGALALLLVISRTGWVSLASDDTLNRILYAIAMTVYVAAIPYQLGAADALYAEIAVSPLGWLLSIAILIIGPLTIIMLPLLRTMRRIWT